MLHPQRDGQTVFRLLQCPTCLAVQNRDIVGAVNMIETGLHIQRYGVGMYSGF